MPTREVYARGLRNAYGFCWNDHGEMFATENGPDADAPEELDLIEHGKHYGFPYQFSNWTHKAYYYSPDPPPGLVMTLPIPNEEAPDGGFNGTPLYTPHAAFLPDRDRLISAMISRRLPTAPIWSPAGGNYLKRGDIGFDLLQVMLDKDAKGQYHAHVHEMLQPLARPVDVHLGGDGTRFRYICEYSREIHNKGPGKRPARGRVLELAVKKN